MFLASNLLELVQRVGGPKVAFRIELWRLEHWRTFEPEYFLLDHFVDPSRAAIDVGANEGYYAGRLAQLCRQVHCFEPIAWLAEQLRAKLPAHVVVHQAAVSDTDGTAKLRMPFRGGEHLHGTTTIAPDNPLEEATRVDEVDCPTVRLDSVVHEPVGFIKIDVEGHEMAVLRGAEALIRRDRPVLLVESEKRHAADAPENVFEFMAALGYGGMFLLDGLPRSLGGYRQDVHQRRENLQGVRKVGTYVNNFLFLPG